MSKVVIKRIIIPHKPNNLQDIVEKGHLNHLIGKDSAKKLVEDCRLKEDEKKDREHKDALTPEQLGSFFKEQYNKKAQNEKELQNIQIENEGCMCIC